MTVQIIDGRENFEARSRAQRLRREREQLEISKVGSRLNVKLLRLGEKIAQKQFSQPINKYQRPDYRYHSWCKRCERIWPKDIRMCPDCGIPVRHRTRQGRKRRRINEKRM